MGTQVESARTGVEISKKLVIINSASSLAALVLNVTVLVWLQQFLLSRISDEEYSLLPVLYSIMMFMPLLTIVLTSALGRYITEAYAVNDATRVTQIVSTMAPILTGAGVALAIIGGVGSYYIDYILTIPPEHLGDARLMFALLMFSLALKLVVAPQSVGLNVRQQIVLLNLVMTGGQFLRIGLMFLFLTTISVRVLWVVVATVIAETLVQLVVLGLSKRAVPALRFERGAIRWPIAGQLLSFGGWSTITGLAMTIQNNADAVILNKLGSPLDVTCFYIGSLPLQQINRASSAVLYPLNPALIAMHSTGQKDRLRNVFLKGGRWALWFSLFVAMPLMVYGRELITLYVGTEYETAGLVMLLVLLVFPFGQGTRMMYPLAEATARIRRLSVYLLAMSAFNLALTLYLVGVLKMGAMGSGLGTAISIALFYPLFCMLGLQIAEVKGRVWIRKTLIPGLLPSLSALLVLGGLKVLVPLDSWLAVILCSAAGGCAYLATIYFACLQPEDRNDLEKLLSALERLPGVRRLARAARRSPADTPE